VKRTPAFWLDLPVKLLLLLLLAFGALSGLERFAGKAFRWRLIGYAIAAFLVPAIWAIRAVAIALRRTAILWELAGVTSRSASAAQRWALQSPYSPQERRTSPPRNSRLGCTSAQHVQNVPVNLLERLRRWWKPAEYDREHAPSDGEGHPLSPVEREEEAEPNSLDDVSRTSN